MNLVPVNTDDNTLMSQSILNFRYVRYLNNSIAVESCDYIPVYATLRNHRHVDVITTLPQLQISYLVIVKSSKS